MKWYHGGSTVYSPYMDRFLTYYRNILCVGFFNANKVIQARNLITWHTDFFFFFAKPVQTVLNKTNFVHHLFTSFPVHHLFCSLLSFLFFIASLECFQWTAHSVICNKTWTGLFEIFLSHFSYAMLQSMQQVKLSCSAYGKMQLFHFSLIQCLQDAPTSEPSFMVVIITIKWWGIMKCFVCLYQWKLYWWALWDTFTLLFIWLRTWWSKNRVKVLRQKI